MGRPHKYTIENMHRKALDNRGQCLSTEYKGCLEPLKWRCKRNHIWMARPFAIMKGNWCIKCWQIDRKKHSLEEVQKIAQEKGGRCLFDKYTSSSHPMQFECEHGHIWKTPASSIFDGSWCPECYRISRLGHTIEDMQYLAAFRGGKCLSKEYVNNKEKLFWQCANEHIWQATPQCVIRGIWCQHKDCKITKIAISKKNVPTRTRYTIFDMKILAESRGGKCLSEIYTNNRTPLLWKCAKGHQWKATPQNVLRKTWCKTCAIEKRKLGIERMREVAKERGGKCMSDAYKNGRTHLLWECSVGHTWKATPASVIRAGQWCPTCWQSRRVKYTIEDMREYAAEHGGKCLSEKYVNSSTPLEWQCAEKHIWMARPDSITRGEWCQKCHFKNIRPTVKEIMETIT